MRSHSEHVPAATQAVPADLEATPTAELRAEERVLTTGQIAWRRFKRHKLAIASGIALIFMSVAVIAAPLLTPYTFSEQNLAEVMQGPSAKHWLGTDNLGRDVFTRLLYGGRISLLVGVAVAISAVAVGTVVGSLAGYYGGWLDNVLMRVTDLFLSIPFLVVLIVASKLLGGSVLDIVFILSLVFWMPAARIVRGVFLSLKEKEFVESARSVGGSSARIIFFHILPNVMGPIIVIATLDVANAILTESALSFLGFGVQLPTPTWGNLLRDAQNFILLAPGLVWFPGLAILITVLAVNFLGDGLRDAFDPHQKLGVTP